MIWKKLAFPVLFLGTFLQCQQTQALQLDGSGSTSASNEDAVIKRIRPALIRAESVGRLYYNVTDCSQALDVFPVPFPAISLSPSKKRQSIPEIFRSDAQVIVSKEHPQIVRITIGKLSTDILGTRISEINFDPTDQYNPSQAILAIMHTKEVHAAALKFGVRELTTAINELVVQPAAGLPHLPPSLKDVTVDQALDSVAKKFDGLILFGTCSRPAAFSVEFADLRASQDAP